MKLRKGLSAIDFSLTENRSSWRSVPDTRTFNVSVRRVEGERTPGMLSWPTLERDMAGRIIPRPVPEVGERGERVVVGEGVQNPMMERMISKRWPAAGMVGVSLTRKKGATRSVSVAARRDINPSAALIRSAACVVVKAIRLRSAPTLPLF